jgi:glycosyltransferase involved in cell wall biosynthesis
MNGINHLKIDFIKKIKINMKIAVVIPTYKRNDGKSEVVIERALESVFNQTHKDFKVYVIGDKYEGDEELIKIINKYDSNKIVYHNLEVAKERDFYTDKWVLWSYGGVNARNYAIDLVLNDGYEYICPLDHDDWYLPNHLEEINKCIKTTGAEWVCTKSTYGNTNKFLPEIVSNQEYIEFHPRSSRLIHSSVCMNFKKIPLKYRDIYEETQKLGLPADADLWERTREFIIQNNLKSYHINKLTCRHDEEGYERK